MHTYNSISLCLACRHMDQLPAAIDKIDSTKSSFHHPTSVVVNSNTNIVNAKPHNALNGIINLFLPIKKINVCRKCQDTNQRNNIRIQYSFLRTEDLCFYVIYLHAETS